MAYQDIADSVRQGAGQRLYTPIRCDRDQCFRMGIEFIASHSSPVPGSMPTTRGGRAGRDGNPARCVASRPGDLAVHKGLVRQGRKQERAQLAARLAKVDEVGAFFRRFDCRQIQFGQHYGSSAPEDQTPCGVCDVCTDGDRVAREQRIDRKNRAEKAAIRKEKRSTPSQTPKSISAPIHRFPPQTRIHRPNRQRDSRECRERH